VTVRSRTFSLTVTAAASSATPAWFTDLPAKSWKALADGTGLTTVGGDRLDQAALQSSYVWPTDPADPLTPSAPVTGAQGGLMNSPSNYCQNSNGMAVDAAEGDCLLVANGGHGGYMGNETMRLNLRSATPGWERYIDSTPPWHIQSILSGSESFISPEGQISGTFSYACYTDGPEWTFPTYAQPNSAVTRRPAAMHTSCIPTYAEGKVWLSIQNSTNLEGGSSTFSKLAVNIASRRVDPTLKLWTYGDIAPWEFHGVMTDLTTWNSKGDQTNFLFPTSGYDPETGRIWTCPGTSAAVRYFWMMETRGPNAGRHQAFQNTGIFLRTDNAVGGAVTCDAIGTGVSNLLDLNGDPIKLFILYGRRQNARDVYVLNLTALEAEHPALTYSGILNTNTWAQYLATDATPMRWVNSESSAIDPAGTLGPQQAWGCVWHEGSKALLMFNCDHAVDIDRTRNGNLRKLALPLLNGRYNPTGSWLYRNVATVSGSETPGTCLPTAAIANALVRGGSFSRFNIMRNFDGVGNDLLVSVNAWDNATSVMKIPASGI
jgi:hypothetical protein